MGTAARWIGLVAVLAVACSPPKPKPTCGPLTCGGCCQGDSCQLGLGAEACGLSGVTCVACFPGQTCRPSVGCIAEVTGGGGGSTGGGTGGSQGGGNGGGTGGGGTGGGTGGGASGGGTGGGAGGGTIGGGTGGGSACDGCRLATGSCSPLALSGSSVTNCGAGGGACIACGVGEFCTAGVCTTPPQLKTVGSACLSDSECQAGLGAQAICKQLTTSGNGAYTGGYCTLRCGSAGVCPGGATCVGLLPAYGEDDIVCWDNCSATDRCRTPGYACYQVGSGSNACWISPLPALDAGAPADKVGSACTSDAACMNPPTTGGLCLTRAVNFNWPGGYCSKEGCLTNAECSTDGGALCLAFTQIDNLCVQRCADSTGSGQSTCRGGYRCEAYVTNLADGGQLSSADGFCVPPPPPAPTSIGDPCTSDLDCLVPADTVAQCYPGTFPDGGPSGFPGGTCTLYGCGGDPDCSQDGGATCLYNGSSNVCVPSCPAPGGGQSTCRAGYVCSFLSGISTGFCSPACNAAGSGCDPGQTCNPTSGYCN